MLSMIIPALQSICKTTYEKPPNLQVHLQNMANCAARFRTLASIVSDSARRQVLMNLADCLVSALAPLTPH
jgi:hypothetical protein